MIVGKFVYDIAIEIRFSKEEINILERLGKNHYDEYCKSVSYPGKGSFLAGWITEAQDADFITVFADIHKLSTLAKILEQDFQGQHVALSKAIWAAIKSVVLEQQRMNACER